MDLGSTNGTFLNGDRVEAQRYYELREKDTLRFAEVCAAARPALPTRHTSPPPHLRFAEVFGALRLGRFYTRTHTHTHTHAPTHTFPPAPHRTFHRDPRHCRANTPPGARSRQL